MTNYNYSLQKYKGRNTRFQCPECLEKFEFTKYIHNETGEYLDDSVGRCNNQDKCGYHKPPREYFIEKGIHVENYSSNKLRTITKYPSFINDDILISSLYTDEQKSDLFNFLNQYFDENKIKKVFMKYLVGVSDRWLQSVIFWQIDLQMKVRAGKIMQYDSQTGRRNRKNFFWIKNETEKTEMQQVFFGLHLLNFYRDYKIGIVESEKTALLCDLYFDEKIIWLASGGMEGINERKLKDLEGRGVILFPDLSKSDSKNPAYKLWKSKAETIGKRINIDIKINNFLEIFSSESEKENQLDIGDYIIKDVINSMQSG